MDQLQSKREPRNPPITALDSLDPETFDWKAYCGAYKGRALITRLLFIASLILSDPQTASPKAIALARAAASQAIPLLRETWDVENYYCAVNFVSTCITRSRGSEPMDVDSAAAMCTEAKTGKPDIAWVAHTQRNAQTENSRLNVELNGFMSNLIKESIRLTYLAMAQLSLKEGSLQEGLKSFQHVREYSSGAAHHVELGLAIINATLSFNEATPLAGNIPKVEAMIDRLHPVAAAAPISSTMTIAQVQQNRAAEARNQAVRRAVGVKLRVARAILALSHSDYQRAARELGEVGEEGGLEEWDGEAISTPDVAFLCAMCTLATGSREHTRRVIVERASFHASLGDHQGWVMDLVRAFVDARYSEALSLLHKAEAYMVLNPFLSPHTTDLLMHIRTRGIVQYLSPFSTVRISAMAAAFGTDETAMLTEVCDLAERGSIPVKVDLVDRVLKISEKDPRADAFRNALASGTAMTQTAIANTFRMRLKEAEVIVHAGPKEKRREFDWGSIKGKKRA